MQQNHFFLFKKLKNTESAHLWVILLFQTWAGPRDRAFTAPRWNLRPWAQFGTEGCTSSGGKGERPQQKCWAARPTAPSPPGSAWPPLRSAGRLRFFFSSWFFRTWKMSFFSHRLSRWFDWGVGFSAKAPWAQLLCIRYNNYIVSR